MKTVKKTQSAIWKATQQIKSVGFDFETANDIAIAIYDNIIDYDIKLSPKDYIYKFITLYIYCEHKHPFDFVLQDIIDMVPNTTKHEYEIMEKWIVENNKYKIRKLGVDKYMKW